MKLPGPVQVEVYPDHEDFAVRTMGMPGLGALGVTFGEVVAMDSPSGRKPGDFNWGAHAVARDEPRLHPHGHQSSRAALVHRRARGARRDGSQFRSGATASRRISSSPSTTRKLLPVAELDRGFVRPDYPGQVIVTYFQAGRICDYIQSAGARTSCSTWSTPSRKFAATPEVIQQNLGMLRRGIRQAVHGVAR